MPLWCQCKDVLGLLCLARQGRATFGKRHSGSHKHTTISRGQQVSLQSRYRAMQYTVNVMRLRYLLLTMVKTMGGCCRNERQPPQDAFTVYGRDAISTRRVHRSTSIPRFYQIKFIPLLINPLRYLLFLVSILHIDIPSRCPPSASASLRSPGPASNLMLHSRSREHARLRARSTCELPLGESRLYQTLRPRTKSSKSLSATRSPLSKTKSSFPKPQHRSRR
jgi:hypothetical protein